MNSIDSTFFSDDIRTSSDESNHFRTKLLVLSVIQNHLNIVNGMILILSQLLKIACKDDDSTMNSLSDSLPEMNVKKTFHFEGQYIYLK